MEEKKPQQTRRKHQLLLRGREYLIIEGVVNVESFDDAEIILETDEGLMFVRGDQLHIKELNLESGNLIVTGFVEGLEYTGQSPSKKGKGFFGRFLK